MRTAPVLLALLAASPGAGCGTSQAESGGMVLLPSYEPLPAGVSERDPRLNYHDFGRVPDGDVVRHVFRMRNEDPREVAITRVVPGCGCSAVSLRAVAPDGSLAEGLPIASRSQRLLQVPPAAVAEIEVTIDTRELATKNADKLITISVATDSPASFYFNLEVHLFVERPFELVPGRIDLGRVPVSGGGEGALDIVPVTEYGQKVSGIQELPPGVHAELVSEERAGVPIWVLRAGFDAPLTLGGHHAEIVLATEEDSGASGRPLAVSLQAFAVPDIASEPARLVFASPRGQSARLRAEIFSLLGGQRLLVLGAELPPEHKELLDVSIEPLDPDSEQRSVRWAVTLATRPPLPEQESLLSGTLLLRLDDPQHETCELSYVVHVR